MNKRLNKKGESLAEALVTFLISVMGTVIIAGAISASFLLADKEADYREALYAEENDAQLFLTGGSESEERGVIILKSGKNTDEKKVEFKKEEKSGLFVFR